MKQLQPTISPCCDVSSLPRCRNISRWRSATHHIRRSRSCSRRHQDWVAICQLSNCSHGQMDFEWFPSLLGFDDATVGQMCICIYIHIIYGGLSKCLFPKPCKTPVSVRARYTVPTSHHEAPYHILWVLENRRRASLARLKLNCFLMIMIENVQCY